MPTMPATPTLFGRLPAELNNRIFEMVADNCQPNIASCRLVCQELRTLSSPYLITRVVIAERVKTLVKAREVMAHPYFRNHVTHIHWDASYFDQNVARDYSSYQHYFEHMTHTSSSRDPAYIQARSDDEKALTSLEFPRHDIHAPRVPRSLRGVGELLDYGLGPIDDRWEHRSPYYEPAVSAVDMADRSSLFRRQAEFEDYDHMSGCHLGFPDYHRRWIAQERIRGVRKRAPLIKSDTNQAQDIFRQACDSLPNVRHASYGDWRQLARDGESYDDLARRLFGHTVVPRWDLDNDPACKHLTDFLRALTQVGGKWQSLTIGRNPFETNLVSSDSSPGKFDGRTVITLPLKTLLPKGPSPISILPSLRSLSLPLLSGGESDFGRLRDALVSMAPRLETLELLLHTVSRVYKLKDPADRTLTRDPIFAHLMSPLRFEKLRCLVLRGFAFSPEDLQDFLLAHAGRLRELHLIDCYCKSSYSHFRNTAAKLLGPKLALKGVEIFGLRFTPGGDEWDFKHFATWAEIFKSRQNWRFNPKNLSGDAELDELNGYILGEFPVADWAYERPELEAALLGGRWNDVARWTQAAPNDEARVRWHKLPNFYY